MIDHDELDFILSVYPIIGLGLFDFKELFRTGYTKIDDMYKAYMYHLMTDETLEPGFCRIREISKEPISLKKAYKLAKLKSFL